MGHARIYVIVHVKVIAIIQCVCVCVCVCLQRELKLEGRDNELEQERLRGSNIVYGEKVQVHVHSLSQTAGLVYTGQLTFTLSNRNNVYYQVAYFNNGCTCGEPFLTIVT